MEILELLEQIEDVLDHAVNVPLTGKCLLDKDEVLELIQEIRLRLPEEIRQARNVTEDKDQILADANQEAENILKNAESRIAALVDEHEITQKAYEQAEIIIGNAKKNAREIRLGTRDYADGLLVKVEEMLEDTLDIIKVNRQELK